jgi:hypothetical protein
MGHLDRTEFQDMLRDVHISNVFQREAPSLIRLLLVNNTKDRRRCLDKIDTQKIYTVLEIKREEGDAKRQNDRKQFANALLLRIHQHCRKKGKRLVNVFRLKMDADFGSTVDLKQLRRFVKRGLKMDIDRVRLKEAFADWDQNGNGSIEMNELEQVMRSLRRSQATGTVLTRLIDDRAFHKRRTTGGGWPRPVVDFQCI